MKRLSMATAAGLLPYDRSKVTAGMVHLGVGAFHRAHVAAYVDSVLSQDPSWGIIGVSLRRPDTRAALLDQDFLYTLAIRSAEGTRTRFIGSLLDVLDANTQREAVLAAMADPGVRIVSLTVTEKGYCHDPATGELDATQPDVRHDLDHPESPVSAPGLIVRALELRKAKGIPPFTVLSCDNLPANGHTTRRIVTRFASLRNAELGNFIREHVGFPSTMVDRIVPATTDDDRKDVASLTGLDDAWPVVTEPFQQWVVEDHFTQGRPALETAGVEFVKDVAPFELMKLRMLNGSHSTLAYLGYLAGHQYVSEAIAQPAFRSLISALMTEDVMPTLPMERSSLVQYRDALLDRFSNPALRHRTWQIAMDGSQKLPQRLLGTIRDRLKGGHSVTRISLGVAAWMRYVTGIDEQGQPIDVRDPLAARLRGIADAANKDPARLVDGLLKVREIFGDDLPASAPFRAALHAHVQSLLETGSQRTVENIIQA
ncbi:mannitol dehydrogenase family protein [Aestuariivirga sp.]|uniref:mannitol dehydrogenase family protein n=1 Tax=Aestuariivirga sp. TaxID=2650926 RepID=UPI0039E30286